MPLGIGLLVVLKQVYLRRQRLWRCGNMAAEDDLELLPILSNKKPSLAGQSSGRSGGETLQKSLQTKSAYRTVLKASILILIWWISPVWVFHNGCARMIWDSSHLRSRCIRLLLPFYRKFRRYFLSTLLSMWNRKLLDREHGGIFQLGPFPGCFPCWDLYRSSFKNFQGKSASHKPWRARSYRSIVKNLSLVYISTNMSCCSTPTDEQLAIHGPNTFSRPGAQSRTSKAALQGSHVLEAIHATWYSLFPAASLQALLSAMPPICTQKVMLSYAFVSSVSSAAYLEAQTCQASILQHCCWMSQARRAELHAFICSASPLS